MSLLVFFWIAPQALDAGQGMAADSWYVQHALDGSDGCLAVRDGKTLRAGDRVLLFAAGEPAGVRRITEVVSGESARQAFNERGFGGVYEAKALWDRIGCYWSLGMLGDPPPPSVARYDARGVAREAGVIAIMGLPASAVALGGDGKTLDERDLAALARSLATALPKGFSDGRLLRYGRRYGPSQGHELIELFVGKPTDDNPGAQQAIRSIDICRVFLHNRQALSVERFSRASGREERVDTEAPQLDERNWFLSTEETLGYVSRDGGATWERLSTDVGFEGVWWVISRVAPGSSRLWEFYLYTRH